MRIVDKKALHGLNFNLNSLAICGAIQFFLPKL